MKIVRHVEATRELACGCIASRLVERGPKDRPVCYIMDPLVADIHPGTTFDFDFGDSQEVTYGTGIVRFRVNGGMWWEVDDPALCGEEHPVAEWYDLKFAPNGAEQHVG